MSKKEAEQFLRDNLTEIVEFKRSYGADWFYCMPDDNGEIRFSEPLFQGTALNPENFEPGQWVLKFNFEMASSPFHGIAYWLMQQDIEDFLAYPGGKATND
jgi:hypothetical protein